MLPVLYLLYDRTDEIQIAQNFLCLLCCNLLLHIEKVGPIKHFVMLLYVALCYDRRIVGGTVELANENFNYTINQLVEIQILVEKEYFWMGRNFFFGVVPPVHHLGLKTPAKSAGKLCNRSLTSKYRAEQFPNSYDASLAKCCFTTSVNRNRLGMCRCV